MGVKILVVEDEEKLARFIELELRHEGYEVEKAFDGRTALNMAMANDYTLILLDIMLPGLNGLEVLRRLQMDKPTPVILLTARDAVMDKVSGLDAGAVDYITKPFAIEELLARIRVALKLHCKDVSEDDSNNVVNTDNDNSDINCNNIYSSGMSAGTAIDEAGAAAGVVSMGINSNPVKTSAPGETYTWKDLVLDVPRHKVTYNGEEIELTNREFLMLKTLLENMDIVLSRDTLLERVCGYEYVGETNVIDVYIRYLRTKIDEAYGVKMIQTVRGVGYVIKAD